MSQLFLSLVAHPCLTIYNPMNHSSQASLSITNSRSPLKPMSIESVMPLNHLILCRLLLLLTSIFPSIRVFSNESFLHIRWPKYWRFSFSISPSEGGNRQNRLHLESKTPSWARLWTLSYMPSISGNDIPTGKPGPPYGRTPGLIPRLSIA